jgi:glycosyltransferase involved in cell wall biosynthesis
MGFAKSHSTATSKRKKLTVVLPFYTALQCLDLTVRSLQRQTLDPSLWEIVVVDDGSGLPVGRLLESVGGDVATRLVTANENVGRAAARNMGVLNAEGDIILFHDADLFIAPDAVERHYEFHQRSAGSVLLGARYESTWLTLNRLRAGDFSRVGNQIECGGERHWVEEPVEQRHRDVRAVLHGAADPRELIPHDNVSKTRAPWFWVVSHSLSLPRSMFIEVGMFDEDFQGWGFEDYELGYRLYVHGGRRSELFTYDSKAVAFHIPHYFDPFIKYKSMQRNTDHFLRKHARFDVEIFRYSSETTASLKIPIYEEMIAYFLTQRLGSVTTSILDLAPRDVPLLVVGTWLDDSPSPPDKTICYDHSRPPSQRNKHLLGMSTLLEDRAMEAVINVDFWRLLMPDDLNRLVAESLRVAQQLILVQTHGTSGLEGLMSSCATMDFVADMLAHHRSVTTWSIDGADVLRVT